MDGYQKPMSDDTPESLIPYDEIVQEALRDVEAKLAADGGVAP